MLEATIRLVKMWFGIGTCEGSHGHIQSRKLQWKSFVIEKEGKEQEPLTFLNIEYPD